MPVIEAIPQAVKMGQNLVPANATKFGQNQGQSQKSLSTPVLFPGPTSPIKYPVIGVSITAALLKVLALSGEQAGKMSGIISKMKAQYDKEYSSATDKRSAAQTKLYNDLVEKKTKIVTDNSTLEEDIEALKKKIVTTTEERDKEKAKYQSAVFEYSNKAKELENAGKFDEADMYVQKVKDLDHWFGEITLMTTDIINLKLELKYSETILKNNQELINTEIINEWETDCDLASKFEVAIPYYPDLPNLPQYPAIPQAPNIPPKVRTLMIQMAKWMVCPLFPTAGVAVSATLLMIKEKSPHSPKSSADQDSKIDALIPKMAGGF